MKAGVGLPGLRQSLTRREGADVGPALPEDIGTANLPLFTVLHLPILPSLPQLCFCKCA